MAESIETVAGEQATTTPEDGAGSTAPRRWLAAAGDLFRRYPATTAIILVMVAVGIGTGALWGAVSEDSDLYQNISYGLPPLMDGEVWRFVTGAFFVPSLVIYLPVLLMLVVFASTYERRVGHWQTLVMVVGGQIVGAIVTALLLRPFLNTDWTWAASLGRVLDTGISVGGFAVLGALTAVMQPVWRRRVRTIVTAYLLAMALNSGLLWDVEHLIGWLISLPVGPFMAGRAWHRPDIEFGPRTQRALIALIVAIVAISELVEIMFPGNGGPFRGGGDAAEHPTHVNLLVVVVSLLLLVLADGLRRGRRLAWWVTTGILVATLVGLFAAPSSASRTADFVLAGTLLLLLLISYPAFSARTVHRGFVKAGRRLLLVAALLFVYTAAGFVVLRDDFVPRATPSDMMAEFFSRLVFVPSGNIEPATTAAEWFVNSIGAVWIVVLVVTVIGLIYSSRRPTPQPEQGTRIRELLHTHSSSSLDWMLTWQGNTMWFTPDGNAAIGYRVVGTVALCLADPIGPHDQRLAALKGFDDFCFRNGWIPCLFSAGAETAALAPEVGWKSIQVAEDAIVGLEGLEFKGKDWQDVRTAMNRAGRENVRLDVVKLAESRPVIRDQLEAISGGWVSDKSLPEMGFTLGTLREAEDPEVRVHLAIDADSNIEGFTSWMPVTDDGQVAGWTIDLMRRRDRGFRAVMEFLIGASALRFKDEGYHFISLSGAPLAKAPEHLAGNSDQEVLQKLLDFLGESLEPYYGFRSLLAFKAKFRPEFRPMYLVFPNEAALVEIGIAIARAYMPDATLADWAKMSWEMVVPQKEHAAAPASAPAPAPA